MIRVFHLTQDLGPTAAAKQLSLIAPALPGGEFTQAVGVLGDPAPFADRLAAGGVPVLRLPVRHAADAHGFAAVVRAVAGFRPDVLHAWGPAAARAALAVRLAAPVTGVRPRVVLTGRAGRPSEVGPLTRRLLSPAGWLDLPHAVGPAPPPPDSTEFRRSVRVPLAARLIVAAGRFDPTAALRQAIWAFDVLRYAAPDIYLVLLGDGPDRDQTARLGKALGFDDDRVRFAGTRADVPAVLRLAEVVWITHVRGGANLALEAMAAGVPVVALANPDVAAVVTDDRTGRVVPPGDRVRLAAITQDLLDDPAARARLGAAGRETAAARFAVGPVVDRFARSYHDVIASGR